MDADESRQQRADSSDEERGSYSSSLLHKFAEKTKRLSSTKQRPRPTTANSAADKRVPQTSEYHLLPTDTSRLLSLCVP